MNDDLLQYLADTDPVGLEYQLLDQLKERALRKIQALNDDDLMEAYDYVGELAEKRRAEFDRRRAEERAELAQKIEEERKGGKK